MSKKRTKKKTGKKTGKKTVRSSTPPPRSSNQGAARGLLTVKQAADMAGVTVMTVYRWVEDGLVDGEVIAGRHFVLQGSLKKHLARREDTI